MSVRVTPGAAKAVASQLEDAAKGAYAVTLATGEKRGSVIVDNGKNAVVVNNRGKVEAA